MESLKVLAIDDSVADACLLERALNDVAVWDIRFRHRRSFVEAAGDLADDPPEIVFLDHQLECGTGLNVLSSMRRSGSRVPVVLLTGQGSEHLAVAALHEGANDYMNKSDLAPATLRRTVASALEKSALENAIAESHDRLIRTNRELEHRNEEIRRFYQTLSHELKTPLSSAREFTAIIRDGIAGPLTADQDEYLGLVLESCDQMLGHINDLLDVTRLETGKLTLVQRPEDVGAIVRRAVTGLGPEAERLRVRIRTFLEKDVPEVHADATRVQQVLTNLIRNALKFSKEGSEIVVRAAKNEGAGVAISVEDNGPGIAPADTSQVFERLFQGGTDNHHASPGGGGLGLGLFICRELVALHGGELTLTNRPEGGVEARFTLPRHLPLRTLGGKPRLETLT